MRIPNTLQDAPKHQALHEAAHATVALALSLQLDKVRICINRNKHTGLDNGGLTNYSYDDQQVDYLTRLCITALAGPVMSATYFQLPMNNTPEGWTQLIGTTEDFKQFGKIATERIHLTPNTQAYNTFWSDCVNAALVLIEDNEIAINTIQSRLLDTHTVSRHYIKHVLARIPMRIATNREIREVTRHLQ